MLFLEEIHAFKSGHSLQGDCSRTQVNKEDNASERQPKNRCCSFSASFTRAQIHCLLIICFFKTFYGYTMVYPIFRHSRALNSGKVNIQVQHPCVEEVMVCGKRKASLFTLKGMDGRWVIFQREFLVIFQREILVIIQRGMVHFSTRQGCSS